MAQGSLDTLGSNSCIKRTSEDAVDPKQYAQSRELLFINCFSVDRTRKSHNPDRKTIGAHVQRIIRETKRMNAEIKLKPATIGKIIFKYHSRDITKDEAVDSPNQWFGSWDKNVSLGGDVSSCSPAPQTACSLDDLQSAFSSRQSFEDQLEKALILLEGLLLRLPNVNEPLLDASFFDGTVSGEHSKWRLTKTALRFFLETFIPAMFPVSVEAKRHRSWVIQSMLASPELLFAILAVSAASFLAVTRNPVTTFIDSANTEDRCGAIFARDAAAFEIIAVKLLRSAIEANTAPNLDILLYSIMCLMVTEIINGDTNAIKVHTNALRGLMQSQANSENLPSHVLEPLLSSCYLSSTIIGDPPIPPPLHEATIIMEKGCFAFASTFKANLRLKQLGQAFFEPQIKKILGPEMVSIFRDMSTFVSWREQYHLNRSYPNPEEIDYFHALHWRSHFSALNFPFQPQHALNNMQEPCRIALLIFWNASSQINRPGSVLYRTLAAKLRDALERPVPQSFWEKSHGILTWILLLGAFITEWQPERRWFVMKIASSLRNTGMILWDEMEPTLLRFLYLERIYQKGFELIWTDAIEMLKGLA